jgi:hypothetical protein
MNRNHAHLLAALTLSLVTPLAGAQAQTEESRAVAGGGITAPGWMGVVDANEARRGGKITDAKLATMGGGLHVTTGPATTYWNSTMHGMGDYTVRATFTEQKYMGLNDHPHPYGIMIAGNGLDTEKPEFLYCAAYGNGNFIFRGFSSTAERGSAQGRREGPAGDPGDRRAGQGRQGLVHDQRHRGRELRQERAHRRREGPDARRHGRYPLRAQHRRARLRFRDDAPVGRTAPPCLMEDVPSRIL